MKTQTKFITEVNNIKEFTLSNDLKILLKPNHSIPLVTFSIWYKVGSRNEENNARGLAHFLEHMMFKGTKKYKKGEISELIQRHGGVFNAFTSNDGTAYYETISPKYLEKVIEIEADRMKSSILAEEELNLERTVVLSELEGDLNNPVSLLDIKVRNESFEKSPYKHPTIGYIEDIKGINSDKMREFYRKYYNPGNSTIVLVGDFDETNALNLIEKYFSNIKNDNSNTSVIPKEHYQPKEKRVVVERSGSFKILEIAYHIPEVSNKDIYPLNIIEEILIKGKKSPLKKAIIEKGLATEIYGGAETNTDPTLFYLVISLTPKASHKQVEKIVFKEIDNLIKNPPTEEEIQASKNRIRANYLFNLDGPYNQALNLGFFELINSWKQSLDWPNEISKVTRSEIIDALKKYFQENNRTIGYFIPKIIKGEKYAPQPLSISRTQHYPAFGGQPSSISPNNFKYHKKILTDGSKLLIYKNIDLPITYISGVIKGGSSLLPKEKELNCEIIARTLEKGSKNYTKDEIETILDHTGSHINFSCDEESFTFNIAALNENLIEIIRLFTDILMNPVFPKNEIKTEKEKMIAEIIEAKDNTGEIARRKISQLIYPNDHPFYTNTFDEDIKLIKKIKETDLINSHEKLIKPNIAIISLVTSLSEDGLSKLIYEIENGLNNDKTKVEENPNIPDTIVREVPRIEISKLKDKLQSDVILGHAGFIKRTDPDFYKINLANYILGGSSLTSRLAKKVRDNAGLVYTVYSYVNASHGKGEFGIYFGSNNDNVDKGIELVKDEIKSFVKNGISEAELIKAKSSLIDSFISRNLPTYKNIAYTLVVIEFYNLGENYINDYTKILSSIKLEDVNKIIKKYFHPDKLNVSIAGDYKEEN